MKYVPNLIPKDKRVLPNYFKVSNYSYENGKSYMNVLGYAGGGIFAILGLLNFNHLILTMLYLLVATIVIPPGHRFIETKFQFRLTNRIKAIFCSLLLGASLPIFFHYKHVDTNIAKAKSEQEAIIAKQKSEEEQTNKVRQDSLTYYYQKAISFKNKSEITEAEAMLGKAGLFAASIEERGQIEKENRSLGKLKALILVQKGSYRDALPLLSTLLEADFHDTEVLNARAKCLFKAGRIQEAVNDLKVSMDYGSSEAKKLHEKINPLRKRVSYYVTLCCDGSFSSAKGRGACSWHGGVCDWNHPVYEEYRKYN